MKGLAKPEFFSNLYVVTMFEYFVNFGELFVFQSCMKKEKGRRVSPHHKLEGRLPPRPWRGVESESKNAPKFGRGRTRPSRNHP